MWWNGLCGTVCVERFVWNGSSSVGILPPRENKLTLPSLPPSLSSTSLPPSFHLQCAKLCLCSGGPVLCHAGRLRFRRKTNAAAAALVAARLSKQSSGDHHLQGLHELAKTATFAGNAMGVHEGGLSQMQRDGGGGIGSHGMNSAAAAAGLCGAAPAVRSATPWLQNMNHGGGANFGGNFGNVGNLGGLGNLGNLSNLSSLMNSHMMSSSMGGGGFPPTSSLLAEFSAAMGVGVSGHGQQGGSMPQSEEVFGEIASMNVSLRSENAALRQRLAIVSARVESQGECQLCGKDPSGADNGHGHGGNNSGSLMKQAQAAQAAAVSPMIAELEALKQRQQMHHQQQQHQQQQHHHHQFAQHHDAAANLAALLAARLQSSSDNLLGAGAGAGNMNNVSDMNKFMMATQAAFGAGAGGNFHSQLGSQLSSAQLSQQHSFLPHQHEGAGGNPFAQHQQGGGWDANMAAAAAAAAANDTVRNLVMQASQQQHQQQQQQAEEGAASDPMSALLKSVQMHQKAVLSAAGGARTFPPAVLEAINNASASPPAAAAAAAAAASSDKSNDSEDIKVILGSKLRSPAPSTAVSPPPPAAADPPAPAVTGGNGSDEGEDVNVKINVGLGNKSADDGSNQGDVDREVERDMKRPSPDGSTDMGDETITVKRARRISLAADGSTEH
jgi:hypothetical protein